MKRLRWGLFVLALAAGNARAQRQQIRFSRLGTEQGLSHSNAMAIFQDSRGFMWIGTRDGLNKYDGYQFTVFRSKGGDPTAISNSFITSIAEDAGGDLWIGTWGGGVNRYDRGRGRFVHYDLPDPGTSNHRSDFINSLIRDRSGRIWIGTDGGGLDILDPRTGKCTNYYYNGVPGKSPGDNDIKTIFQDREGRVWIGTVTAGLYLYDSSANSFLRSAAGYRRGTAIYSIYEDSRGRLWIGTVGGGLDRLELSGKGSGSVVNYHHDPKDPYSLPNDAVQTIAEDDKGNLWVGTENGGLAVEEGESGRFRTYAFDEVDNTSLSNNSIDYIYRDIQGNMWICTFSGGINVFNKDANKFVAFRHDSSPGSLGNNNVLYLLEDSTKTIWIATDGGGIERMDPSTGVIKSYLHSASDANSMSGNFVLSLLEDPAGQLWAGTWGDGLTVIDKTRKKFTRYKNKPGDSSSLGGNNVYSLVRDKDGDIWASCFGDCLDRLVAGTGGVGARAGGGVGTRAGGGVGTTGGVGSGGRWRHYRHDPGNSNSPASSRIHTLLVDRDGYLWIGSFDGGLDRLDKKTGEFRHFIHSDDPGSLANNSVNSLYEDRDGYLWVGTAGGLSRLDRRTGRFRSWTTANGLPNSMVYAVQQDRKGYFWISSNHGLSRLDLASGVFRNYSAADGLQSNEFKAHSCLFSSSGLLYFGGVNGFNEFDPDSIVIRNFQAPLVITSFKLFNKEVPVGTDSLPSPLKTTIEETRELLLGYSSSDLSFEFASLDYTISKANQYAYRLDGFDTGWNYIGTRRMANYTNVDPGRYTLTIRTVNSDGSWSSGSARLGITITPPFWGTWWFRVSALLFVIGLVVAIHRTRLRHLRSQKQKLEKEVAKLLDRAVAQGKFEIAGDLLHDLGNAIVGFGAYLTRARKILESGNMENLSKLSEFLEARRESLAAALGEDKAAAVIAMLQGVSRAEAESRDEMRKVISEQQTTTARVQDILHIQRQYISGQESQERKPVSLRSVVDDCKVMLFATLERHRIAVRMEMADEQFTIKGDRTRLMQMVLNLLKNSVEAVEACGAEAVGVGGVEAVRPGVDGVRPGGVDAVRPGVERMISIKIVRSGQQMVLSIRDTGHGFSAETAASLFVRGFSTRPSGGGTGLYNARTIVESHGGSIELTSEGEMRGALAVVMLPS